MKQLDRAFARYRQGRDAAALGEVFDLAAPEVLRIATYLVRDGDRAEDLVQQTFLAAIESADRFDPERPVMPWLLGILANQVRGQRRRHARKPDPSRLQRTGEPNPAVAAGHREMANTVHDALARIEEPYRAVLTMSLDEGLSPKEIAASLDRPQGTVRSQLHRGLDLLRKALPLGFAAGALGGTRGLAAIRAEVLDQAVSKGSPAPGLVQRVASMPRALLALALVAAVVGTAWGVLRAREGEESAVRSESAPRTTASTDPANQQPASTAPTDGGIAPDDADSEEDPSPAVRSLRVTVDGKPARGVGVLGFAIADGDPVHCRLFRTDAEGRVDLGAFRSGTVMFHLTTGDSLLMLDSGEQTLEASRGMTIRGVVRRKGAPVADASILHARLSGMVLARTDAKGSFVLEHVKPDTTIRAFTSEGALSTPRTVRGRPGDEVNVELDLALPGGVLAVDARDSDGNPIEDAIVLRSEDRSREVPERRVRTDAAGRGILAGLSPGTWRFWVRRPGFIPWSGQAEIRAGETTSQSVTLTKSAEIRGRVRDTAGNPVAEVNVRVDQLPELRLLQTAADGTFRLRELPATPITVVVGQEGPNERRREFHLEPGAVESWDIEVDAAEAIEGIVLDEDGKPGARWAVAARQGEWKTMVVTDAKGQFRMTVPSRDQRCDFHFGPMSGATRKPYSQVGVRVDEGTVRLVAKRAEDPEGAITGRILDTAGKPLGGLIVMAIDSETQGIHAGQTSHKDGSFRVPKLRPGTYRVYTHDENGKQPVLDLGEHVVAGTLPIGDHRMPVPGFVRARVVAPEGARVAHAGVTGDWVVAAVGGKREEDGGTLSPPLAPGRVRVVGSCLLDGKAVRKEIEVEVRSGETTEVTVDLTTGG